MIDPIETEIDIREMSPLALAFVGDGLSLIHILCDMLTDLVCGDMTALYRRDVYKRQR